MSDEAKKEAQDAELNPEEMDKFTGGYICHSSNPNCPWEIISDTDGCVIGRYAAKDEAIRAAQWYTATGKNVSTQELTYYELQKLRNS